MMDSRPIPTPRRRGFTLIELMVVVAILGLVTGQILAIFSSQLQTYQGQKAVLETQDDARLSADLVFSETRMAGYMVPQAAGLAMVDGGNAGTDWLCVSDASVMDEDQVDLASDRFSGATVTATVTTTDVELDTATLDIDGDGGDDFAVDSGIILVSGTENHCGRITAIAGNRFRFAPAAPAGWDVTGGVAVPAIVYEVNAGLRRNNLVVSGQVEDFQVELGIDLDDDGQLAGAEFPIHGLYGQNPTLVRRVQLSVLARTAREDPSLPMQTARQQIANRVAAAAVDDFRRRLVTVSATPRNML